MQVNSICILGGGTSGFATASVFARYKELSGLDFNIRVIHSEEIGTVGVGESTIFSIRELFYYLGLKDKDWMPQCNATYKTSVRFENFYKQGRYFYYPFGPGDLSANEIDWFDKLSDVKKETMDIGQGDCQEKYQIAIVPTIVLLKDGEEVKRFQADLSFKMVATRKEIQATIDEILMSDF